MSRGNKSRYPQPGLSLAGSTEQGRPRSLIQLPRSVGIAVFWLGIFNPPFKVEVSRAMMSQPDKGYASISYQIQRLVVNPLRSLARFDPVWSWWMRSMNAGITDNGTPSIILSSLARYVTELSPLKFFVTSLPGNYITIPFRDKDLALLLID